MGVSNEPYPTEDGKCTWLQKDGKRAIIITMNERLDSKCPIGRVALLVHEAVHAWQYILEDIGQHERPGKEIEAYAIQHLCLELLNAYQKTRLAKNI